MEPGDVGGAVVLGDADGGDDLLVPEVLGGRGEVGVVEVVAEGDLAELPLLEGVDGLKHVN